MGIKDIKRRLSAPYYYNEAGCLTLIALFLVFIAVVSFIFPFIKLIFCGIFGIRCIDDETGEIIEIPWSAIGLFIGTAVILFFIESIYFRLKKNK